MRVVRTTKTLKILDFDVETVAAGFADPNWVPQKITCVAWSWIGEEKVESRVCGPMGLFGKPELRTKMLKPLMDAINEADMLTGHNIIRFDLPVINSECMRLGLPVVPTKLVQDTMRLMRSKGFKKGQDNIGRMLKLSEEKQAMDWQQWQDAYDEAGWAGIRSRCETDIIQHKTMRVELLELGLLKTPTLWKS
jgi:DNA polymerase elongation subunit (family B)